MVGNIKKLNLTKLKLKKNIMVGKILLELNNQQDISLNALVLVQRNGLEGQKYKFPIKLIKKYGKKNILQFNIDLQKVDWKPYYWDVFVSLSNSNGEDYEERVKLSKFFLRMRMNFSPFIKSVSVSEENHVFPYCTYHGSFSLTYKTKMWYESKVYQWKWVLALLTYVILMPYLNMRNIWLGFEKNSNTAQDNGFTFFKYCYIEQKHKNFFYVIKKSSSDMMKLNELKDKVLIFMSFKYMLYLLASRLLISSESRAHIYDIRINRGLIRRIINKKRQIFLQHGVIGLKRVDNIYKKKSINSMNLFITSSHFEKEIILNHFGYDDQEIAVTGLSRWDNIENKVKDNKILIVPTWRSWMDDISGEEFLETVYYKNYSQLVNSRAFLSVIEANDLKVNFFLHPKFEQYANFFSIENDKVNILTSGNAILSEEIMESSLLITDYSSVAWDMYYLKKPIIFFQFDLQNYLDMQGSYMNFSKELIGDQVFDIKKLVNILEIYAKNKFEFKGIYMRNRKKYITYEDSCNNERIYKALMYYLNNK
ncbi:hypothetical protein GCM10011391_37290 [Pullulanibacillus camelliae]|uniref:Uncharacterized protein n=1 Tax=Pullulanibacillus camelliae TaxID=1707096 RepID=A0A8J2YNR3_9BACL|nr:CDP-glycerol glycerophosphotransferase family protein [Pullulanibacillus camelliae]GGE54840.1 hypothetical protein GCM10011391_37290 [Pullulanibacillus camelliae]